MKCYPTSYLTFIDKKKTITLCGDIQLIYKDHRSNKLLKFHYIYSVGSIVKVSGDWCGIMTRFFF